MHIAIDIPDDIGNILAAQAGGVSRAVLEAVDTEAYRSGAINPLQVQQMLGLNSRWESRNATGLDVIEEPRSACMVRESRAIPCLAQVSPIRCLASAALSRWATIQPTTWRLKTSKMRYW